MCPLCLARAITLVFVLNGNHENHPCTSGNRPFMTFDRNLAVTKRPAPRVSVGIVFSRISRCFPDYVICSDSAESKRHRLRVFRIRTADSTTGSVFGSAPGLARTGRGNNLPMNQQ